MNIEELLKGIEGNLESNESVDPEDNMIIEIRDFQGVQQQKYSMLSLLVLDTSVTLLLHSLLTFHTS